MLSRIPISPGIHFAVFNNLKAISKKMEPHNRCCVLLFDEMSIEPHLQYNQFLDETDGLQDFGTKRFVKIANHVQIWILQKILDMFHVLCPIPIFNSFGDIDVASQITENIKNIIRSAQDAGLTVVATVCDQGGNNKSAINALVKDTQDETGSTQYLFTINNEKIVPLFDVPHLLKTLGNILLKSDIYFKNKDGIPKVAKWKHIEKTWELDSFSGDLRALPKITEYHVNRSKIKKMKVSVATQVFSHSVAATMNLLISNGNAFGTEAIDEARGTVEFIKFVDDVFDSLNGSAIRDMKGKPLRTSASTENTGIHEECWKTALKVFESMYVMDNKQQKVMPCFMNWQITLNGFIHLKKRLKDCKFTRMKTRRFNQDPLENLFGKIRQRGGRFTKPTTSAFCTLYKSLLVNGLVSKHSVGANCEEDRSNVLIPLQRFLTQGLPEDEEDESADEIDKLENRSLPANFQPLKPLESAALSYVAGYIVKVKTKITKCIACKYNIFKRPNENDDSFNLLIKHKEYGGINNIITGKDERDSNSTSNILRRQAKDIFEKRKKYVKNVINEGASKAFKSFTCNSLNKFCWFGILFAHRVRQNGLSSFKLLCEADVSKNFMSKKEVRKDTDSSPKSYFCQVGVMIVFERRCTIGKSGSGREISTNISELLAYCYHIILSNRNIFNLVSTLAQLKEPQIKLIADQCHLCRLGLHFANTCVMSDPYIRKRTL
ncbi:hypothetical protein NQ315_016711 [Exocentrus adspersus]|uniref:Transposable element P transposase n=1 Tax=Exocentrus adspersus TaxID=1586481 RepID=A0AAV8VFJ7_9CUCU|nr:hypothetical protein NQ315_016711 [Exocentrus adspersus]